MALLSSVPRIPGPIRDNHHQDRRLHPVIVRLVLYPREYGGVRFNDKRRLSDQLYAHPTRTLNRSVFTVGIDNTLPEKFSRLYPRLVRTTREAAHSFEAGYDVQFSEEEVGLMAVIFDAWLMQEKDLHKEQVILLTGNNGQFEVHVEQQLCELTLLPPNIKHIPMQNSQKEGILRGVTLIITPCVTLLPLFSPPLIHADLAFTSHQQ